MPPRTYDDDQLRAAVAGSSSWRGVLRHLGLKATSAAASRSVRSHADRLGLDTSHFTGQRRWTEADLKSAVAASTSWSQVAETLGLVGGSGTTTLKGHAARLGIDTGHFGRVAASRPEPGTLVPDLVNLPRAGAFVAATWLAITGHDVSWPLEPCAYDLVAHRDGRFSRIQVKTTRRPVGDTWLVVLQTGGRERGPYDPDDIDAFFVVDGDLNQYLIPVAAVAGFGAVHLAAYADYRVATSTATQ